MSHHAVTAALRLDGLASVAHAAKRHDAIERAADVAARRGFDDVASYIGDRRAAGWTWQAIAAESGQPESWLRLCGCRSGPHPLTAHPDRAP